MALTATKVNGHLALKGLHLATHVTMVGYAVERFGSRLLRIENWENIEGFRFVRRTY